MKVRDVMKKISYCQLEIRSHWIACMNVDHPSEEITITVHCNGECYTLTEILLHEDDFETGFEYILKRAARELTENIRKNNEKKP